MCNGTFGTSHVYLFMEVRLFVNNYTKDILRFQSLLVASPASARVSSLEWIIYEKPVWHSDSMQMSGSEMESSLTPAESLQGCGTANPSVCM